MEISKPGPFRAGALTLAVLLAAAPASAGGFGIFEQGSKAMGMAGAFTAQADDPSAMFHNVGGLAFLNEREFALGFTLISSIEADFQGAPPFPGPGVTEELEPLGEFLPHFYWVEPLGERLSFGLAINSPFGLLTDWKNKSTFSGRFISTKGQLLVLDLNPNIGWQATDKIGIGFGLIARFSEVELNRNLAAINPFTGQPVDIGSIVLESDPDQGFGWQFGFLHRYTERFSWGFSYRSEVEIDYGGDARLNQISTGNPLLDAVIGASLPFGRDLPAVTSLKDPAMASLGVALTVSPKWLVEVDVNWTGWSVFDQVVVEFTDRSLPDLAIRQDWSDAFNYRLGLRWTRSPRAEWRFGYVLDETPQPLETRGPLLPDAERDGFTIGYGHQGSRMSVDLALMYLLFDDRTTLVNQDGFNGTYSTTGLLFGATVGW